MGPNMSVSMDTDFMRGNTPPTTNKQPTDVDPFRSLPRDIPYGHVAVNARGERLDSYMPQAA